MTEADILAKMQARVENSQHQRYAVAPKPVDWRSDDLTGALNSVRTASDAIGVLNLRNPGFANNLIQQGKRLIQRSLSWYTRSLRAFSDAVADALQRHTIAIRHVERSLERIERRLEHPPMLTRQDIPDAQQEAERVPVSVASSAQEAEASSVSGQEEVHQLRLHLEQELCSIRSELEAGTEQLHELRKDIDKLRSSTK